MGEDWFIVSCTSGKELASCRVLERLGYEETFYPMKRVEIPAARRKHKAKSSGKPGPKTTQRAWVPGYVFVRADFISVYRVNGPHGLLHMRVLSPGGKPYTVTDDQMAQMRDVPKRVRELVESVAEAERIAWEAVRPKPNKLAVIKGGPWDGVKAVITKVQRGQACFDLPFGEVCVPEQMAELVA